MLCIRDLPGMFRPRRKAINEDRLLPVTCNQLQLIVVYFSTNRWTQIFGTRLITNETVEASTSPVALLSGHSVEEHIQDGAAISNLITGLVEC